ncbi:unnamed protein product, partial [Ectocarpus sp. 12 AP-2014]
SREREIWVRVSELRPRALLLWVEWRSLTKREAELTEARRRQGRRQREEKEKHDRAQQVVRHRQARAEHFKMAFYSILKAHETAVAGLLEEAMAAGAEAPDALRLGQARKGAVEKLTANYVRRQETSGPPDSEKMRWGAMVPRLHDQVMAPLIEVEQNMHASLRRKVEDAARARLQMQMAREQETARQREIQARQQEQNRLWQAAAREREEQRRRQAEQRAAARETKRLEKLRVREELKDMRVEEARCRKAWKIADRELLIRRQQQQQQLQQQQQQLQHRQQQQQQQRLQQQQQQQQMVAGGDGGAQQARSEREKALEMQLRRVKVAQ